jgi:hypothetical protein
MEGGAFYANFANGREFEKNMEMGSLQQEKLRSHNEYRE